MTRTFIRGLPLGLAAALCLVAPPTASVADGTLAGAPTLVTTRWGTTPKGATRIVFQLDRPAEYRTIEAAGGGLEIQLPGVAAEALPAPMPVGSGGVRDVTFRRGPSGVVALIAAPGTALAAHTFRLDDPPRVVVDVTRDDSGNAPRDADPASRAEPERSDAAAAPAPAADPFRDLLAWIARLQRDASALELGETEQARAAHRRSLAIALADRGLAQEAEAMLAAALASGAAGLETASADSLLLVELRLETGDVEQAAEVARALSAARQTPEPLRLAGALSRCGLPDTAAKILEEALPRLAGRSRPEGQLLLARAYWNLGDVGRARKHAGSVTGSERAPAELRGPALVLEADCAWAQGRIGESERLYQRAIREDLGDEDASWVTLQLGNAARREGRRDDAIGHYRDARDRWPDTVYGAQADWFLRVTERVEPPANTETPGDVG